MTAVIAARRQLWRGMMMSKDAFRTLMTLSSNHSFTQSDINKFAEISGDHNPIHVETEDNKYGRPIVHGTLILGHLSGMIATSAPGSLLLHMDISFDNYLHVDEMIRIEASPDKLSRSVLTMKVSGTNSACDKTVFSGTINAMITKDLIRKLRTEHPELVPGKSFV